MSEINDLRERVEAAEQRFGLMDEQQRHYSERVIGLIETIEAQLADARGEIEKQIAENQRLGQENEELRTMLHSVLRSIEEKTFTQTLQNLESRVSALVDLSGARQAAAQNVAADSAPEPESEPEIDVVVEAEDSDPETAETGTADPLIIEAADSDDDGGESTEFEAAADEDAIDQGKPDEAQPDEAQPGEAQSDEAVTADAEMPDTVAFEDADPEEIAAETEAETADEMAEAPAEESLQEAEAQFAEAPEAEANEDDGQDAVADSGSDIEIPAEFETDGEPATAAGDEGEDIFAAMNLLNADDEDFAAAAQGTAPLDDDVSVHEAAAAEGDFAAPEAPEIQEEPAAEVAAETPVDGAAEAEDELSDAVAERLADEVPEELANSVAPTVKEIIRRVGDLARELERAEVARRNSHSDEHAAEAAGAPEPAMTEAEGDAHPALDHAANG